MIRSITGLFAKQNAKKKISEPLPVIVPASETTTFVFYFNQPLKKLFKNIVFIIRYKFV